MRRRISDLVELAGAAMIAVGSFQIWTPLGFVVTGGALVGVGFLLDEGDS